MGSNSSFVTAEQFSADEQGMEIIPQSFIIDSPDDYDRNQKLSNFNNYGQIEHLSDEYRYNNNAAIKLKNPNINFTYAATRLKNPIQQETSNFTSQRTINNNFFNGIWTKERIYNKNRPQNRIGQISITNEVDEIGFALFGQSIKDENLLFNDIWKFDPSKREWSELRFSGDKISPRFGAAGVFIRDHESIFIFGGNDGVLNLSDIYIISLSKQKCAKIETKGIPPSPRIFPVIGYYDEQIFIWGGYTNENSNEGNELFVLDLKTMVWETIIQNMIKNDHDDSKYQNSGQKMEKQAQKLKLDQKHKQKKKISKEIQKNNTDDINIKKLNELKEKNAGIQMVHLDDHRLIGNGNKKNGSALILDMKEKRIYYQQTRGNSPPPSILASSIRISPNLLLYYDGQSDAKFSPVYALDIKKFWWFIFYITPDGVSTSIADGFISELNWFYMPKRFSCGIVNCRSRREIVSFLGFTENDNENWDNDMMHVWVLNFGKALGVVNMRDDMLDILGLVCE